MTLPELERRALELVKAGDFGEEATRVNAEIAAAAPANHSALKRLGRCLLEQQHFDEAADALRAALALNPADTIATNLLAEVRKRRALRPATAVRPHTGFTGREFSVLERLAPDAACETLAPRIDALFDSLNATDIAGRIGSARRGTSRATPKLFQHASCHAGPPGHIYALHNGGRWEPQFNLGWFSAPPHPRTALRAGIAFDFSPGADDPDSAAGQDRVVAAFERFQQAVARSWKDELADWMARNGGFLQHGHGFAELDLLPSAALEWLLACDQPIGIGWMFVGRWLFLDRSEDAVILADRAKLARFIDETFRTLYPLWLEAAGSRA